MYINIIINLNNIFKTNLFYLSYFKFIYKNYRKYGISIT